ncbi:MAG: HDIG domain-containing protein [Bdellovibrionales bacterium]|nr:HDIG domain-containing protein [Bdellovibrionales bacterium]
MIHLIIIGLCGLLAGLILALIADYSENRKLIQKTKTEANIIVQEAEDREEALFQKTDERFSHYKKSVLSRFEKEREIYEKSLRELQGRVDVQNHQLRLKKREQDSIFSKIAEEIGQLKNSHRTLINQIKTLNSQIKKEKADLIDALRNSFTFNLPELKIQMKKQLEEKCLETAFEKATAWEKTTRQNLQKQALFYLNAGLNRFQKNYCPERGVEPVLFQSKSLMRKIVGPNRSHLNQLEKECGVDIVLHEAESYASIYGIDPVRRELGRITLKKLSKKKHITPHTIKTLVKTCKKDLFRKIEKDGKAIGLRLGLRNIPKQIQNMMGALRYRYSFAQNQHFHCEEVGWLCGMLSAELNLPLFDGRRAGFLHDIGKAMDHAVEGNHAVIGADFISRYGEKDHIAHAVRAHHHDEPPSTILAWLVISADAISGSRPGARRFTEHSYARKLATLERIIDSFKNIIEDAYIMNAGREMRVIVNNTKVTDQKALDLSKDIAREIEQQCSYPGLIKVTVVRHSEVAAIAH